MSTFVCLGDSQLGVASVSLADQEAVWDRIVDLAIEREVGGVLHGGDLFEHVHVTSDVHAAFRRPLARLREAGIPMLLIRGNHDGATRPVDALDVFREYPNLIVSQRPEIHELAGVGIVTLPWTSPAGIVAASNGDVSRDQINDVASRALVGIAAQLLQRAAARYDAVLLLAHWSISSGALPNGLPVDQLKEPILDWSEIDALGFDAVVVSHIHAQQRLDDPALGDATLGFYTGSPQQLNFGEHGDHGAWVLDIESGVTGNAVSAEFAAIESRRFVTLDLSADDLAGDLMRMSGEHDLPAVREGDIVRIRFEASEEQANRIDHRWVREWAMQTGASKVVIEPQVIRASRARSETITDQLTPSDALRAYCAAQETDEATTERMVKTLAQWSVHG